MLNQFTENPCGYEIAVFGRRCWFNPIPITGATRFPCPGTTADNRASFCQARPAKRTIRESISASEYVSTCETISDDNERNVLAPGGKSASRVTFSDSSSTNPVSRALSRTSGAHKIPPGSSPPRSANINPSSAPMFSKPLKTHVGTEKKSPGLMTTSCWLSNPIIIFQVPVTQTKTSAV